jgi:hypothetical protein
MQMKIFALKYAYTDGTVATDCTFATAEDLADRIAEAWGRGGLKNVMVRYDGDRPTSGEARFDCAGLFQVNGTDTGQNWNGWACPKFTLEQAHEIIKAMNADPHRQEMDPGIPDCTFDAETKIFTIYECGGWWDDPDEGPDKYGPDADGFYHIGSHLWCWERVDRPTEY